MRDAARVISEVASGARVAASERGRNVLARTHRQVEQMLPLVGRVIAQTRARIFAAFAAFIHSADCFRVRTG